MCCCQLGTFGKCVLSKMLRRWQRYVCRTHLWELDAGVSSKAWMGFLKPWLSSFRKIRYWVSVVLARGAEPGPPHPQCCSKGGNSHKSLQLIWPYERSSNKSLRSWSWISWVPPAKAIPVLWQIYEPTQRKMAWALETAWEMFVS